MVKVNYDNFNSSTIYIVLDIEMIEHELELDHYNLGDILIRIGGMIGFATPILSFFSPFIVIYFIYLLASIIKDEYEENHRLATVNFLYLLWQKLLKKKRNTFKLKDFMRLTSRHHLNLKRWVSDMDYDLAEQVVAPQGDKSDMNSWQKLASFRNPYQSKLTVDVVKPLIGKTISKINSSYDEVIAEIKEEQNYAFLRGIYAELDKFTESEVAWPDMHSAVFMGLNQDKESSERMSQVARLQNLDFSGDLRLKMTNITNKTIIRLSLPDRLESMKLEDRKSN